MDKYFKSHKRPEVDYVEIFSGEINSANWIFSLPIELVEELCEKYKLPKYLGVCHRPCRGIDKDGDMKFGEEKKDVLLLNYEDVYIEYTLDTSDDDSFDEDYCGDDYRTAKEHNGKEYVTIHWSYDSMCDGGDIMCWEGYEGDEYFALSDFDYELPEDMNACHPIIELTGEDKDKLLKTLYPIMDEVLDGDPEEKKKLYDYCGD